METREITQGHIYYLRLNGVYDRCEDSDVVAVAESVDALNSFYMENLLPIEERYRDEQNIFRSFKKGPLRNYNTIDMGMSSGIKDFWIDMTELSDLKSQYLWVGPQSF